MKKIILIGLIGLSSILSMDAQNSPFYIWGTGLNGNTYQKSAFYTDISNGLLIEGPLNSANVKLPIKISWRGDANPLVTIINGKFGIGTPSPAELLHVDGTMRSKVFVLSDGNSTVFRPNNIEFNSINGTAYISNKASNGSLALTTSGGSSNIRMFITGSGYIGMGTTTPSSPLEVKTESMSNGTIRVNSNSNTGYSSYALLTNNVLKWSIYNHPGQNHSLVIANASGQDKIIFSQNGNVAINGKLEATEIKVTTTPTADHVFASDYKLRSLQETEAFIQENQHLPEIASANQMLENGVNMAEFQIQLLQKIEELTLYVIELEKKSAQQQVLIDELVRK